MDFLIYMTLFVFGLVIFTGVSLFVEWRKGK
jgi:hypothetical protein